jgi:hypothetical protein
MNLHHFPLSTTHKDQVSFQTGFDKFAAKRKQNKVSSNVESNRSSKKKINSARYDNNTSNIQSQ